MSKLQGYNAMSIKQDCDTRLFPDAYNILWSHIKLNITYKVAATGHTQVKYCTSIQFMSINVLSYFHNSLYTAAVV